MVVGGGPTGVETAGALAELYSSNFARDYPDIPQQKARIVLVEASPNLFAMFKPRLRSYADFTQLAQRLRKANSRLSAERAEFLARHWGREAADGTVLLRGDPAHKIVNPVLYRYDEMHACWQQVSAPVLSAHTAGIAATCLLGVALAQVLARR